jgi:hypothetical protein
LMILALSVTLTKCIPEWHWAPHKGESEKNKSSPAAINPAVQQGHAWSNTSNIGTVRHDSSSQNSLGKNATDFNSNSEQNTKP